MGAELFIVLEREIPGFDTYVNGRYLSQSEEQLHELTAELKLTPLMNFFSQNPEEAMDIMADLGADAGDLELPDESWFAPEDGLKTVEALIAQLTQRPELYENAANIVSELEEFQAVLARAQTEGVRWHLGVDI